MLLVKSAFNRYLINHLIDESIYLLLKFFIRLMILSLANLSQNNIISLLNGKIEEEIRV